MSSARPDCGEDCLEFLGGEFLPQHYQNACWRSVRRGHLKCLRYARERGGTWDENTCAHASYAGHLECLRYAHEMGCPWDVMTCRWACAIGNLECLRYAHEHGCPWDALTSWFGSLYGSLQCLRYCLENGCPTPDVSDNDIPRIVVPYLYHRGVQLSEKSSTHLRDHRREHVRKAWTLLRCATALLGAYRRACDRVYSPNGIGYRHAEISFHDAIERQDGTTDHTVDSLDDLS